MITKTKKTLFSLVTLVLLVSCASTQKRTTTTINNTFSSNFFKNQFTGLLVVNPLTKDTLYNLNSHKYFTPASNTKIFTLFTALQTLPNTLPALRYVEKNDTLYFEGTGDPSFLHPYLNDSTVFKFLKKHKNLAFYANNFKDTKFGPGWSWDDFDWYYSPERNAFPIHGNVAILMGGVTNTKISPAYFKDSISTKVNLFNRKKEKNIFYFNTQGSDTLEIPFKTGITTTHKLLENSLEKTISLVSKMPKDTKQTLNGIVADSLYVHLMHESDNFIAEQLLIMASSELTDTLDSQKIRSHILENELKDLRQAPRWVDGSGLSRYNLFTPQSLVHVLGKLYQNLSKERLFTIFPAEDLLGTTKDWSTSPDKAYIYAKSGSLGNNYCLSGYLLTKSGNVLLFSFMNNHFRQPTSEVKIRMQQILKTLHQNN